MKLKPIVASMAAILAAGLATGSAFALTPQSSDTNAELSAMSAQVSKMDAVLDQNQSGVVYNNPSAGEDWFKRITVTGQVNVDTFLSDRNTQLGSEFANGSSSDISVSNATLFIDAVVNRWVKGHLALNYNDGGVRTVSNQQYYPGGTLDEAYITVSDFTQSPAYLRLGRQYVPFGTYERYPITTSLTQLLEQTRATAANVGFVTANGFNGALYGFRGAQHNDINRRRLNDFGAQLGYGNTFNDVNLNANVGYLYNMADVNYIAAGFGGGANGVYATRVGGVAAHVGASVGPFDASVDGVTALQRFSPADLPTSFTSGTGARPWAVGVDVGYSFPVMNRNSRVNFSYQHSGDAALVGTSGMPRDRYLVGYNVNILKNTTLGAQVYHDQNYSSTEGTFGGTTFKSNSTTGVIRLGINLA